MKPINVINKQNFETSNLTREYISPCDQVITTLIKTHISIIKDKEICVHYNDKQGLFASVIMLDAKEQPKMGCIDLPLKGVPKKILEEKNVESFKKFFDHTYLVPMKGNDGFYDRVEVNLSLKGGVKAKIPFQPGLALGSVISGDCISQMEEYDKYSEKLNSLEEHINNLEQKLHELEQKTESRKKSREGKVGNDSLIRCWGLEKDLINGAINELNTEIGNCKFTRIPDFRSFTHGVRSPINMETSRIMVQPRSFDSLSYSSHYINMRQDFSKISDSIEQSSSAGSVDLEVGSGLWKVKAATTWAKGAHERLVQIGKSQKSEGVLVINAMVTTRNVRCFTQIDYDLEALKSISSAMDSVDEAEKKKYGITKDNKLYLLTEAVLGGSFTGLVTFLRQDDSKGTSGNKGRESRMTAQVGVSGAASVLTGGGGYEHAMQSAKQSQHDMMESSGNTKVDIEIFSQGAIPTLMREVVNSEIIKHLDLNPAKFELSQQDKEDSKDMLSSDSNTRSLAICKRQMKMEAAQVGILNECRGLVSSTEQQTVHSPKTVMSAYDNFSDKMTSDIGCGIPVGFNYLMLTKEMIDDKIKMLSGKHSKPLAPEVSASSQS